MLSYLNGIGKSRKSSGGGSDNRVKKIFSKLPPARAVQVIKKAMAQHTPFNQVRVQKAVTQKMNRNTFKEAGEPFVLTEQPNVYPNEFIDNNENRAEEAGYREVDETEFNTPGAPDSEDGGEDIGIIYPGIGKSGYFKKKKDVKIDSKKAKVAIKTAKASAKTAKGTSKQTRAEAKGTRAGRERSGKGAELLNKTLDTASEYLLKKKGGSEESEAPAPTKASFFDTYKMPILIGGAGLVALMLFKGKKK